RLQRSATLSDCCSRNGSVAEGVAVAPRLSEAIPEEPPMRRILACRAWRRAVRFWDAMMAWCEGGLPALRRTFDWVRRERSVRRRSLVPVVELLEVRTVPATLTWTGAGTSNNWSEAANWDPSATPASGDDLVFDDYGLGRSSPVNDLAGVPIASVT